MPLNREQKTRLDKARAAHRARGAKANGKAPTGRGISVYAEDFSKEERSAVTDELARTREALPAGR